MRRFLGFAIVALMAHASAQTIQQSPRVSFGAPEPAKPAVPTPVPAPPAGRKPAKPAAPTAPASQEPAGPVRQGYLYVEPFQTRFEALFDSATMQQWLQPGKPLPESLTPEGQKALTALAAARAGTWCQIVVNGRVLPTQLNASSIVKGLPGRTLPLGENEDVRVAEAMVGFTWETPTPPAPETIEVEWKGTLPGVDRLPIRVFFGPLSETLEVSASSPRAMWKNKGRLARPAPLAAVPTIKALPPLRLPVAALVWFVGGLAFYLFTKIRRHHLPGGSLPYIMVWLLGAVLMYPLLVVTIPRGGAVPKIATPTEAEAVITPLLRNVYRAFDHRSESEIYDVLARSVDGPLLRQLYLETIQALTLEGREGTRVTISEFDATVNQVEPVERKSGFVTSCQWTALGSVGHWGHTHQRVNRYNARLTVDAVKSEWKITALEVTEARRL